MSKFYPVIHGCGREEPRLTLGRCYCGNLLSHDTQRVPENVCSRVCMGDFGSICGGSNALTLYEVEQPEVAAS